MGFELENIVPWGRCLDEYMAMFALSEDDLAKNILGCGDGPASFNAELTSRGGSVVSVDPLYAYSPENIRQRIDETFDEVMAQTRRNRNAFVWENIPTVQALGQVRMAAMERFLADYVQGRRQQRYVAAALPKLPFEENCFQLALCSHLLFLYSDHLDASFHIQSILEMCRVASQVRIFPLLQLGGRPSSHIEPVRRYFEAREYDVEIVNVPYEFQRGADRMLRVQSGG